MADGQVLAAVEKNDRTELRVTLTTWRGRPVAHFRLWERDGAGGWRPTRKGVACDARKLRGLVEQLAAQELPEGFQQTE